MPLNLDQLKQDLCRQMAVIELIEKSRKKALAIATERSVYYATFGSIEEMKADMAKQNNVTLRLIDYLTKLTGK